MMPSARALLTAAFAVLLFFKAVLPLTRRLMRGRGGWAARFAAQARADGRAVTGYIQRRRRFHGDPDASRPELRLSRTAARYAYYGPGGKKYLTRRFAGHRLPDRVELYLYPGNPQKYLTQWELQQDGFTPLLGVLGYAGSLGAIVAVYRLLGLLLP